MTEECITSTLPAIGTPLPAPAATATAATGHGVGKVTGAVRRANYVRRGVRRFRRAMVIVTCVTVGGAAAATAAKVWPGRFGYGAPPPRAVLVGGAPYGDYAALNPSAVGPSYLPLVSSQASADHDLVIGFFPPAGSTGGGTAIMAPGPFPVPAPGALWLFLVGILGLGWARRRRQPDSPEVAQARIELAAVLADREEEAKVIGLNRAPHSAKAIDERIAELRRIIDEPQKGQR